MKIHLASADLDDIRWAESHELIDGVVTTHDLARAEAPGQEREYLAEIIGEAHGAVLVTAHALTGADAVAISADTLRTLLVHPLTDRGVDQPLQVLSRQHASWSLV